jgi:hypothetical protein
MADIGLLTHFTLKETPDYPHFYFGKHFLVVQENI